MADNNVIINPDAPAPEPTPVQALTLESLKKDYDTVLMLLRGVGGFLPPSSKLVLDRLVSLAEVARTQDWVFEVLINVLSRFQGDQTPTAEQFQHAVFQSLVARGQKAAAGEAPAV